MAASAYPDGDDSGGSASNDDNSVTESLPQQPIPSLRHSHGLAMQWTAQEQSLLDQLLLKYAGMPSIPKYSMISQEIPGMLVRDVSMRCRWMTRKDNSKRRKDELLSGRRNKDKKEKVADPSIKPSSHSHSAEVLYRKQPPSINNDDEISFKAIGGLTGQLLEQNAQRFNQISANETSCQLVNNIILFSQIRDNIYTILNSMNDVPEIMKQMPPLHVKIDEHLASLILPPRAHQRS